MIAVTQAVAGWNGSPSAAAKRLEVTQPRLNDQLRGRINNFSLDALIVLASRAGSRARLSLEPIAA
jgi:predicted XRE-type DNA-binding protein